MSLHIRRADASDAQAIWRINTESLGYDYPQSATAQNLSQTLQNAQEAVFVVCDGAQVLGYVHAQAYRPLYALPLVNLLAVAVLPSAQGQGAGRMLLSAAQQWANDTGAKGVRLVSGENRSAAHQFYTACGYTHRKTQKNFVKYWE